MLRIVVIMTDDAPTADPVRIALYSHDAQGLGHIRRHHALAAAMAAQLPRLIGRPVTGLLVSGTAEAGRFHRPDGWDVLVLPALAKESGGYRSRHLRIGRPQIGSLRSDILTSALRSFAPDLLVVDKHPAGVDGELLPALAALPDTRVVLGLREILDDAVSARSEWQQSGNSEILAGYYDRVWVYGDRALHDPFASGEIPAQLASMADFTGYLSRGRRGPAVGADRNVTVNGDTVLTLVGGGEDGATLALAAAGAEVPRGMHQVICTGPNMPASDVAAVRKAAGCHSTVVRQLGNIPELLTRAAGAITMGGYNTICEVLATDTPALVVPRVRPRTEQLIRAQILADAGLVESSDPDVRPEQLGRWMSDLHGRRCQRHGVDLDGLARIGTLSAQLITPRIGSTHVAV